MIVLLGSTGYVGQAFQRFFLQRCIEWKAMGGRSFTPVNRASLVDALKRLEANLVINCAGYTGKPNVDACEEEKGSCLEGNAVLPSVVKDVCAELGIAWGHISSGCIYSGERPQGGGWREDDAPNFSFRHPPCSFYSGTKALGEELLGWSEKGRARAWPSWESDTDPQGYIWRLRIPFSDIDEPRNYLSKLQRYDVLLQARNSLSQLDDFVRACWECIEREVPYGIYNLTNPGSMSTSEVVDLIVRHGVNDKVYRFFENEDEFMALAAKTPRSNCVLDTGKLRRAGIVMRPVEEAIEWSLKHWQRPPT